MDLGHKNRKAPPPTGGTGPWVGAYQGHRQRRLISINGPVRLDRVELADGDGDVIWVVSHAGTAVAYWRNEFRARRHFMEAAR